MDLQLMANSLPLLLKGAVMTLKVTGISAVIGLVLGTLIGLGRTSGLRWLSALLGLYIEVLRGTPLFTQLLLVYFGIPKVTGINIPEFQVGILTIGINSSAYVAEIIRAGISPSTRGRWRRPAPLACPTARGC